MNCLDGVLEKKCVCGGGVGTRIIGCTCDISAKWTYGVGPYSRRSLIIIRGPPSYPLQRMTPNLLFMHHHLENPPSPPESVFRTFQACAVAMARRSLGGTQVPQELAGLPPP